MCAQQTRRHLRSLSVQTTPVRLKACDQSLNTLEIGFESVLIMGGHCLCNRYGDRCLSAWIYASARTLHYPYCASYSAHLRNAVHANDSGTNNNPSWRRNYDHPGNDRGRNTNCCDCVHTSFPKHRGWRHQTWLGLYSFSVGNINHSLAGWPNSAEDHGSSGRRRRHDALSLFTFPVGAASEAEPSAALPPPIAGAFH